MKTYIRFITLFAFAWLIATAAVAQEDKPDTRPVLDPFSAPILIDNPTTVTPWKGTFQYIIEHRFGKIEELSDLYGIYAPSNIRMGLNYGLTENIMIGFGTEKNSKLQDFSAKWVPLEQTRSGNIPVSVAVYGNMAIDARSDEAFGTDYQFTHRLSYFSQIIVSRKFTNWLTVQAAPSFSHFNSADSLVEHDIVGVYGGIRAKVTPQMAIVGEYHQPLKIENLMEYRDWEYAPEPGFSLGIEIGTATHAFQVFAASMEHMVPQKNYLYNYNEPGDFRLGFNITVRF